MLNRSVVMVRPKQPYRDWAESVDDSGLLPEGEGEQTIYLIPSFATDDDGWDILELMYEDIFDSELYGWHTDESAWPQNRSFELFLEWFDVAFHSVVENLCDYEIEEVDFE
jgi:hypothetical protein